jgi:signal transduction histidine kinase/ActR/RegA family two-component response regulator
MRIRSHLLLLAVVVVVPLAGTTAGLLVTQARETRAAIAGGLIRTTRALAATVDGHLHASLASLHALATSPHLDGPDLAGLAQQLEAVQAGGRGAWSGVGVVGPDGRVLLWTGAPTGASLPGAGDGEHVRTALAGRPGLSDLLEGGPGESPAVYLAVPAWRDGRVAFVLTARGSPGALARVLEERPLPAGAVVRVLDRGGQAVAHVPADAGDAVPLGTPDASSGVADALRRVAAASGPFYVASAPAPRSGWTVVLAVPAAVVDAPARRAWWGASAALGILAASLGLAAARGRRIAGAVRALEGAARQVERGAIPVRPPGDVAEVRAAGDALVGAATAARAVEALARTRAEEAERSRRELARRQHEAEEISRLAQLLTERRDIAAVAARIVDALLPLLDADSVTLWVRRDDGTRVVLGSAGRARGHLEPGLVLPMQLGLVGRAAAAGRPVWSRDVFAEAGLELSPELRRRLVAAGLRAVLAVPIRIGDEVTGAVTISHGEPRAYDEREIALVGTFADQAALAFDSARRFAAAWAARARAEANAARTARLQAIGTALSRGLSRAEVTRIVVEQIVSTLNADACSVYLLAADDRTLELADTAGGAGGALGEWSRLPLDRAAPLAEAVRDGIPWFQTRRAERDERYPDLAGVPAAHEAVAYVPLLLDDRATGGLSIAFRAPRPFEEDERRFILTVAQLCAQALDRGRLHEAERAARAHAEAARARAAFLAEASALLAAALDERTMLRRLARLSVPAVADWCVVYLRTREGEVQRAEVVHADADGQAVAERLRTAVPVTGLERHTVVDRVLGDWEAVLFDEIAPSVLGPPGAPLSLDALREIGPRSAMYVPLGRGEGALGAVAFMTAESGRRYDAADLALAEDLARRVALAVENARLLQAAEAASRAKDEFLAMLGHELRNPLGAIANAVAVLDEIGWPRPEAARLGQIVRRQVRHLSRLVDDLLDVSRVVAGRVSLERQRLDLRDVVERCLATLREAGFGKAHTVEVRAASAVVDGDPTRLAQVVNNLLENAAKYTPPGGSIVVELAAEDATAVLRVSDSGIGIPADLLPRIFDPFTQERQRLDRSRGGLGLGLTLVRQLVALHGGTVAAESAGPGRGSAFTVRLPLGTSPPDPPARAAPRGHAQGLRVLVVEDHEDTRQSLRLLLERQGHAVEEAFDGIDGLEQLLDRRPQAALIDVGLPRLNGYELARTARGSAGGDRLYLVAVTGYGQPEDRRRAFEAGFDAHLVKPVRAEDLVSVLGRAVNRAAESAAGRTSAEPGLAGADDPETA